MGNKLSTPRPGGEKLTDYLWRVFKHNSSTNNLDDLTAHALKEEQKQKRKDERKKKGLLGRIKGRRKSKDKKRESADNHVISVEELDNDHEPANQADDEIEVEKSKDNEETVAPDLAQNVSIVSCSSTPRKFLISGKSPVFRFETPPKFDWRTQNVNSVRELSCGKEAPWTKKDYGTEPWLDDNLADVADKPGDNSDQILGKNSATSSTKDETCDQTSPSIEDNKGNKCINSRVQNISRMVLSKNNGNVDEHHSIVHSKGEREDRSRDICGEISQSEGSSKQTADIQVEKDTDSVAIRAITDYKQQINDKNTTDFSSSAIAYTGSEKCKYGTVEEKIENGAEFHQTHDMQPETRYKNRGLWPAIIGLTRIEKMLLAERNVACGDGTNPTINDTPVAKTTKLEHDSKEMSLSPVSETPSRPNHVSNERERRRDTRDMPSSHMLVTEPRYVSYDQDSSPVLEVNAKTNHHGISLPNAVGITTQAKRISHEIPISIVLEITTQPKQNYPPVMSSCQCHCNEICISKCHTPSKADNAKYSNNVSSMGNEDRESKFPSACVSTKPGNDIIKIEECETRVDVNNLTTDKVSQCTQTEDPNGMDEHGSSNVNSQTKPIQDTHNKGDEKTELSRQQASFEAPTGNDIVNVEHVKTISTERADSHVETKAKYIGTTKIGDELTGKNVSNVRDKISTDAKKAENIFVPSVISTFNDISKIENMIDKTKDKNGNVSTAYATIDDRQIKPAKVDEAEKDKKQAEAFFVSFGQSIPESKDLHEDTVRKRTSTDDIPFKPAHVEETEKNNKKAEALFVSSGQATHESKDPNYEHKSIDDLPIKPAKGYETEKDKKKADAFFVSFGQSTPENENLAINKVIKQEHTSFDDIPIKSAKPSEFDGDKKAELFFVPFGSSTFDNNATRRNTGYGSVANNEHAKADNAIRKKKLDEVKTKVVSWKTNAEEDNDSPTKTTHNAFARKPSKYGSVAHNDSIQLDNALRKQKIQTMQTKVDSWKTTEQDDSYLHPQTVQYGSVAHNNQIKENNAMRKKKIDNIHTTLDTWKTKEPDYSYLQPKLRDYDLAPKQAEYGSVRHHNNAKKDNAIRKMKIGQIRSTLDTWNAPNPGSKYSLLRKDEWQPVMDHKKFGTAAHFHQIKGNNAMRQKRLGQIQSNLDTWNAPNPGSKYSLQRKNEWQPVLDHNKFGTAAHFHQIKGDNATRHRRLSQIKSNLDTWNAPNRGSRYSLKRKDEWEPVYDTKKFGSVAHYHQVKGTQADNRHMIRNASTRLNTWQPKSKMKLLHDSNHKKIESHTPNSVSLNAWRSPQSTFRNPETPKVSQRSQISTNDRYDSQYVPLRNPQSDLYDQESPNVSQRNQQPNLYHQEVQNVSGRNPQPNLYNQEHQNISQRNPRPNFNHQEFQNLTRLNPQPNTGQHESRKVSFESQRMQIERPDTPFVSYRNQRKAIDSGLSSPVDDNHRLASWSRHGTDDIVKARSSIPVMKGSSANSNYVMYGGTPRHSQY